jgi:hypothetical protein
MDSPDRGVLLFENSTIDQVTVYLEHSGTRLILGHVEPGRRARLRIPDAVSFRGVSGVRVLVVPLGATREGPRGTDTATAVCSDFEPPEHLLAMTWSLKGSTLVATAMPRGNR